MFNVDQLFDHLPQDVPAPPPFTVGDITLENPGRFMTAHEVKQASRNQTICDLGLIETELDLERASNAINHIMHLYPFLSYGVKFDQEKKWMRYVPQPVQTYNLRLDEQKLTSFEDIGNHIACASLVLNSQKLSHWSLHQVQIPQVPKVKLALSIKIYHSLIDGASVMTILKKFNELYSSASISSTPKPLQLTNYRSVMSCDPSCAPNNNPLSRRAMNFSKMTGQFKEENQFGSKLKFLDQIGLNCNYYKEEDICRVKGVQYSFSLYAVYITQLVGYMFFNKDIKENEEFTGMAVDLRRNVDFLKRGRYPELDLDVILGQAAAPIPLIAKANSKTTTQEIALQFQKQFEAYKLTDEAAFQQIAQNEIGPAVFKLNLDGSLLCSNVGKMDLGEGPLQQMIGFSSAYHVWDRPICYPANAFHRGQYGIFVLEWDFKLFDKEHQKINNEIFLDINKAIIQKGAENVSIQDVIQLYEAKWLK
ncbi:Conserved_hypothetical protein [Hexamita inflata]|uniref:Uncharacterized protein n=1 Tax=Hexamita inflata TaxID=28002 RepID=A0AA86PV82_9EUKA|nr:Conserved hypothetical protein [Hexamita inflata]CAI9945608.1 Conserved hypothetical protein [Hexamita inflata]